MGLIAKVWTIVWGKSFGKGKAITVVPDDPHGLCKRPLRVGVGGVAPVIDGKCCLVVGILQVQVKLLQHNRPQHALHEHIRP